MSSYLKKAISVPEDVFGDVHDFINDFEFANGIKLSFSAAIVYLVKVGLKFWKE